MKAFRSTLILAAIVAVVGVFTYMEYKKSQEEESQELVKNRILRLAEAKIVDLKISRPDDDMHLKQDKGTWSIVEPIQDRADASEVEGLISTIVNRDGKLVEVEGAVDWAQYGLSEPAATIQLTTAEGVPSEIHVSGTQAFDGSYYVRKGDELLISDKTWQDVVSKRPDALRDRNLLPSYANPQEIFLQYPLQHKEIHLKQKDGRWEFASGEKHPVSEKQLQKFLSELHELRAIGFVAESKGEQDLKEYGLHRPDVTVRLVYDRDKESFVEISPVENNQAYAITDSRSTIFKLSKKATESVEWQRDDFRDKEAPFDVDVALVGEVVVKSQEAEHTIKKSGSDWALAGESKDQSLDQQKLENLFTQFSNMKVDQFVSSKKALEIPERRLIFKGNDGQVLLDVAFGSEYSLGEGEDKKSFYYTQSSASKDLLGVAAPAVNALPWTDLIKKKAEEGQ